MTRLFRVLVLTVLAGGAAEASAEPPQSRPARASRPAVHATVTPVHATVTPELQTVRAISGRVRGVVSDERGGPLAGAMVTMLGVTMAMTVTDTQGRFSIDALPAGEYVLRAHLAGFTASRRELVRVGSPVDSNYHLQLRRLDTAVATAGTAADAPVAARPIMAAGFDLPSVNTSDAGETADAADHPHTETAWRLRHIKRSILKDAGPLVAVSDEKAQPVWSSALGRAFGSATSIFTDLPLSGEVNLLTSSALTPGDLFPGDSLPRGIAYISLIAPMTAGDWSIRAAMSQGDLSSWIVAGAFSSRPAGAHTYNLGLSYSAQDYPPQGLATLPRTTEGRRSAGEVYGGDRWTLGRAVWLNYGARYARYDYLENPVFSPRVGITYAPFDNTRVTATVAQRMLAPGAEEFVSPSVGGPWLPPERTFSPLGGPDSGGLRVERARGIDLLVEHEFDDTYIIGVRRYHQTVDDQLVTLFGLDVPGAPQSSAHYFVDSVGAFDADGWALRVSTSSARRVRGSIDYSITRARWLSRGDTDAVRPYAPGTVRADAEDLHDVTTSVETDIPETATHVYFVYKVNTGYTRAATEAARPGFEGRFDVQVNQALPFGVGGTKWEVLVGLRNLFRDPIDNGSVYDELLVLRPPKRVIGGFLVKF